MKKVYSVEQTKNGFVMGRYIADCEEEAIFATLKDAHGTDDQVPEPDSGLKAYEVEPTKEEEPLLGDYDQQ